jgi:hypothetical protein
MTSSRLNCPPDDEDHMLLTLAERVKPTETRNMGLDTQPLQGTKGHILHGHGFDAMGKAVPIALGWMHQSEGFRIGFAQETGYACNEAASIILLVDAVEWH